MPTVPRRRPHRRPRRAALLALAAATVLTGAGCTSDDGSSASSPTTNATTNATTSAAGRGTYLALGDSVPFGYRGGEPASEYRDAGNFTGYPQLVGQSLGLDVVNAACPGETTASFLDTTAQSNGCENSPSSPTGFRDAYPLHVKYLSADQSQLDFAVRTLEKTRDVRLVTLQIGANDGFICQATTADKCASEVTTVAQTVSQNVAKALYALRREAGYRGRIVVVSYYSFDYDDATTTLGIQALDNALAQAAQTADATVASGFDAFRSAAEQAGGNSTTAGLVRPGDVHPTDQGQQLLAQAVESVVR